MLKQCNWKFRNYLATGLLGPLVFSGAMHAQDVDLAEVQRELTIFSGILENSLRLNESTGLFGMSLGGISTTYLHNQGAVLEVRSPLANRRNRMGLASLSSAMQSLQLQQNPFAAMRSSASAASAQISAFAESAADESATQQLLDRISDIDYSALAQSALQQATQSARTLRALGNLDDQSFASMDAEIAALRNSVDENLRALRELETDIRQSRSSNSVQNEPSASENFSAMLDTLMLRFEPVKEQALAKAEELRQRSERAEAEYAAAWQQDFLSFTLTLYETLCEYGDSLSILPADQNLSLILKGLGQETEGTRRPDEVHVVSKSDINACVAGELDSASLRQRATIYTY